MDPLPKIIWINWFQGWQSAPELVQACRRSWEVLNPDWEVRALSNCTLNKWSDLSREFPFLRQGWYSPQVVSDLLRISLLSNHGGVWVDATLLATKPLNSWLPDVLKNGFFAFSRGDSVRMLANWFLATTPSNLVINEWKHFVIDYWSNREVEDHYFWMHEQFGCAYRNSSSVRKCWDSVIRLQATERTILQRRLSETCSEQDRLRILGEYGPVEKLTHKLALPESSLSVYKEIIEFWLRRSYP
jgi:hypothetical protein